MPLGFASHLQAAKIFSSRCIADTHTDVAVEKIEAMPQRHRPTWLSSWINQVAVIIA
jgi:hypothetical protein